MSDGIDPTEVQWDDEEHFEAADVSWDDGHRGGIDFKELAKEGGAMTFGAAAGGAAFSWPGALVGAGIGYMVSQVEKYKKDTGLTPREAELQALKDIGKGVAYEAIGGAVTKGAVKLAAPFAKRMLPRHKEAVKFFSEHTLEGGEKLRKGGLLTPAQATEHRLLDFFEQVAEHSIFGGGTYRKFRLEQKELVTKIADDIVKRIGPEATEHEIGLIVQDALQKQADSFYAAARVMYKNVDELAKPKPMAIMGKAKFARPQKGLPKDFITETGLLNTKALKKAVKKFRKSVAISDRATLNLIKQVDAMPENASFKLLQQWRSDLLQVGYTKVEGTLLPGRPPRLARKLAKTIDNIFSNAEKGLSGEAQAALKEANKFFKTGKEEFSYKLLRSLATNEPEKVVRRIFTKGSIEPIKRIRKIVGEEQFRKLSGYHARKMLLEDAWDVAQDRIVGNRLDNVMRKIGEDTLQQIYTPSQLKALHGLKNTVKAIQYKPPALGGGMVVQLTQAGAIVSLAMLAPPKEGILGTSAILLGPAAMARIFTSPAAIRWLTKGLTMRAGTKEAIKLGTRLVALSGEQVLEK